jgi:hypothetical protein
MLPHDSLLLLDYLLITNAYGIDYSICHVPGNVRIVQCRFNCFPTWTQEFYNKNFLYHARFKDELLAMKASIKNHTWTIHSWLRFKCTEKKYRNKIIFKYIYRIQSHNFLLMI